MLRLRFASATQEYNYYAKSILENLIKKQTEGEKEYQTRKDLNQLALRIVLFLFVTIIGHFSSMLGF